MLSQQECYLLTHYLPGLGPATCDKLLQRFGDLSTAFHASLEKLKPFLNAQALTLLKACVKNTGQHPLVQDIRGVISYCAKHEIAIVTREDIYYPSLLKQIIAAPCLLYVRGDVSLLSMPQLAIVGSRKPSVGGCKNARTFAAQLSQTGMCITSGLALGVDVEAHIGALSVQGKTLAVLGTGMDKIYPKRHTKIAQDILNTGGALVSELPLGTAAHAANFPRRNRIVSGLSLGVLVVEAAIKSGSAITARYAIEYNREVFAIPGSIHSVLSRGCHQLIKEGAALVESSQDIIDTLESLVGFQCNNLKNDVTVLQHETHNEFEAVEKSVLKHLSSDPVSMDELNLVTGIDVVQLAASLLSLEMKGAVTQSGAMYMRI